MDIRRRLWYHREKDPLNRKRECMDIFETHAHYDDEKFPDREQVIRACHEAGIRYIVNCASDIASCKATLKLAEDFPYVYAAIGVHPHAASEMDEDNLDRLFGYLTSSDKVVAVGEIGLDYHYDFSPRDVQQEWFIEQIELAKEFEKPIIVHTREALEDTYDILNEYKKGLCGGIIHSYNGSVEMARRFVDLGFHIGVGGMVPFPKVRKVLETVKDLPMDRLVVETDSPYLAPVPHRGERNDSRNLPYIVEKIAEIRGMDPEEVAARTLENACRLFGVQS